MQDKLGCQVLGKTGIGIGLVHLTALFQTSRASQTAALMATGGNADAGRIRVILHMTVTPYFCPVMWRL